MTVTRKAAALASSSILLLALGVVLGNPYLVAPSVTLTAYLAMARMFEEKPSLALEVSHEASGGDLYEGELVEIEARVRDEGTNVGILEVDDQLPEALRLVAGTNQIVTSLGPGEERAFAFTVRPGVFGVHRVGPISVRAFDTLGLFIAQRVVDSVLDVKVYPKVRRIRRLSIKPLTARTWPGEILTKRQGQGTEFYGVREYSPGDRFSRLNWKASSRYEGLFTNQARGEFGGDAVIILDARTRSDLGVAPESIATYSVRAAAEAAYRLLRDKNRVGVLALGEGIARLAPGTGRKQFNGILTVLISVKPGNRLPIELLPRYLSRFYSQVDQVVLVSPLLDRESRDAVIEIANTGYPVLVLTPSPLGFEAVPKGQERIRKIAESLILLDRRAKLSTLSRYATVVDWNTKESLDQNMRKLALVRLRAS